MVFAFLPTAILFSLSFLSFCGCMIMLMPPASVTGSVGTLLLMLSSACMLLAIKGADILYANSMKLLAEDFDEWYRTQQRIAVRCNGVYRLIVTLNLLHGTSAYDKNDLTRQLLSELRPQVEKNTNTYYRWLFLMHMMAYKTKIHDFSYMQELTADTYRQLQAARVNGKVTKKQLQQHQYYGELQMQFFRHTAAELSSTEQRLTELTYAAANMDLQNLKGIAAKDGYAHCTDYYIMGICCTVLGNQAEADRLFAAIAATPYHYPLIDRVRRYQRTGNLAILLETCP